MKTKKWTTLVASSFAACALSTFSYGQVKPEELKGTISSASAAVIKGNPAQLSWSFSYPTKVIEYAGISSPTSVSGNGGIISAVGQDLNVSLKMLGQGVTSGSTYVTTKGYINYNNTGDKAVFTGVNSMINQNQVINLSPLIIPNNLIKAGKGMTFSGNYFYNNQWSTKRASNTANENPRSVRFLYNGQTPPSNIPSYNAPSLESFLRPYLDATGKVKIGPMDVIVFMELTHTANQTSDPGYDLQDLVMLVTLTPSNYTLLPKYTTVIEERSQSGIINRVTVSESTTADPSSGNGQLGVRSPFPPLTQNGTYTYKLISTKVDTGESWVLDTTTVKVEDNAPPKVEITIDSLDNFGRSPNTVYVASTGAGDPDTAEFVNRSYANPDFAEDPAVPGLESSYKSTSTISALPKNKPPTIRRTRVDKPFKVYVTTTCGAVNAFTMGAPGPTATATMPLLPAIDKSIFVKVFKQAYPNALSYGNSLLPENAILVSSTSLQTTKLLSWDPSKPVTPTNPAKHTALTPLPNEYFPGGNPLDISTPSEVYITATLPVAPYTQLASERIKIWPLSTGQISGVSMGQSIRFTLPTMTFIATNVYPDADVYAVCYPGALGAKDALAPTTDAAVKTIGGSLKRNSIEQSYPTQYNQQSDSHLGEVINNDGQWTVELIENSVSFGKRRLDYKTFGYDRSINVNASITTSN